MRRTRPNKGLASRMYKQVWLSFTGLATMPSALVALARRATRPSGEPGQSASAARLNTGKWTRELLKHLEWRRMEELCAGYFEELGFKSGITHDRDDGGVDINLYAAGAERAPILVQCRAWDAYPIGIKTVPQVLAALTWTNCAEAGLGTP